MPGPGAPGPFSAVVCAIGEAGADVLERALALGLRVPLVLTRARAGHEARVPADVARDAGVPCLEATAFGPDLVRAVADARPDILLSGWFHLRIPQAARAAARLGAVNLHPSLLPAYRGATPVQWCVMRGETRTGLTLHLLAERFDAGDVLWQREMPIGPDETADEVLAQLRTLVGPALEHLLARAARGDFVGTPQDESLASTFPKRGPEHGRLSPLWPTAQIHNVVRGLRPWPLASLGIGGTLHAIGWSRPLPCPADRPPGTVLALEADRTGLDLACGDGCIIALRNIDPALPESLRPGDALRPNPPTTAHGTP